MRWPDPERTEREKWRWYDWWPEVAVVAVLAYVVIKSLWQVP